MEDDVVRVRVLPGMPMPLRLQMPPAQALVTAKGLAPPASVEPLSVDFVPMFSVLAMVMPQTWVGGEGLLGTKLGAPRAGFSATTSPQFPAWRLPAAPFS